MAVRSVSILYLIALLTSVASVAGLIFHSIYTVKRGPVHLVNQFVGVWLTGLILILSAQLSFTIWKPTGNGKRISRLLTLGYFLSFLVGSVVLLIGFGLSSRPDGIGWSSVLLLISGVNIYAVWHKQPGEFERLSATPLSTLSAIIIVILRILTLIVLGFLCWGSLLLGIGTSIYQPRGIVKEFPIFDGSGRHQQIHFHCDGPKNNSYPVFLIETDGSHGMADCYGLQMLLIASGRRTCIWDKPGLGHSENMLADQLDYHSIYHSFFLNFGEIPPFILIGQGGGGELIYQYAIEHPEMVHSLVYLDVYPYDFEWNAQQQLNNLTDDQIEVIKSSDLRQRLNLAQLIRGLGCPWGLLPLLLPPSGNYFPPERYREFHWFMLTDKTWTTQYYFMQLFPDAKKPVLTQLSPNISLVQIMSKWDDSQVIRKFCAGVTPDSPECQYQLRLNNYSIAVREELIRNLTLNYQIRYCTDDDCGLAYLLYGNPKFTAKILSDIFH